MMLPSSLAAAIMGRTRGLETSPPAGHTLEVARGCDDRRPLHLWDREKLVFTPGATGARA
jgi:hypothetical protein